MQNDCYKKPQSQKRPLNLRQHSKDAINQRNQNQGARNNVQQEQDSTPSQNIKKREQCLKPVEGLGNQQGVNIFNQAQPQVQKKGSEYQLQKIFEEQESLKMENEKLKQVPIDLQQVLRNQKKQIEQNQFNLTQLEDVFNDILTQKIQLKNEQQNNVEFLQQQFIDLQSQHKSIKELSQQLQKLKGRNEEKMKQNPPEEDLNLAEINNQIVHIKEEIKRQDSSRELLANSLQSTKVEIENIKRKCNGNDQQLQNLIQNISQPENQSQFQQSVSQLDIDSLSEQSIEMQNQEQQIRLFKQKIKNQDQKQQKKLIQQFKSQDQKQTQHNQLNIDQMYSYFDKQQQQIIQKFEEETNQLSTNFLQISENQIHSLLQVELNKIINEQLTFRIKLIEEQLQKSILDINTFKDQLKQDQIKMIETNQSKLLEILNNNNYEKLNQSILNQNQVFDKTFKVVQNKIKMLENQICLNQKQQQVEIENQNHIQIISQQQSLLKNSGFDHYKPKETPKKYLKTQKTENFLQKQSNLISKEIENNKTQEYDQSSNQQDQFQQYQLGENNFQEINQEPERNSQILHPNIQRLKMVQDFINEIYDKTSRQRSAQGDFRKFIRDEQNANELYQNYGIKQSKVKKELAKICKSFRQVRGDGNCFYTAFGFQFCEILFYKYSQNEFKQFIQQMDQIISFKINYGQEKSIQSQELQKQCWDEFKFRLQYFRNKNNKFEFIQHFQAYEQSQEDESIDGCFYGLSTIFFRNLSNYLIDNSVFQSAVDDQQNLLIWEEECNSNEVVIQELAKFLQVHIKLVFFDQGSFYLREYLQGMPFQIILLIKPGHYNVGYQGQDIY